MQAAAAHYPTIADYLAAVQKVAGAWANSHGVTVQVVEKNFGNIRDDLATVDAATAPDVIVGAHDWTGQLAANGLQPRSDDSTCRRCWIRAACCAGSISAGSRSPSPFSWRPYSLERRSTPSSC